MNERTGINIGDKMCSTRVRERDGKYYGELLIDGKQADITGFCASEAEADRMLTRMVVMYRKSLVEQTAWGARVRELFLDK